MIENLINQIELRYRIVRFKKLYKQYLLNRMEKNNVYIIEKAIDDIKTKRY